VVRRGCLGVLLFGLGCGTAGRSPEAPAEASGGTAAPAAAAAAAAAGGNLDWARPLGRPGPRRVTGVPCAATAPGLEGAFSGVVANPVGGPLRGVRLQLRATPDGPALQETRTGLYGEFVFTPASRVGFIQVSAAGFPEVMFRAEPGVRCQVAVGPGNGVYDEPLSPGQPEARGGTVRLWGSYTTGFEQASFRPCGRQAAWWVESLAGSDEGIQRARREARCRNDPFATCTIYVEVTAEVTELGAYGHLDGYARQMHISQVHAVSHRLPRSCR
jgi:hypothetical protein